MQLSPDITLTLVADDFNGYEITTHSALGASFISAHLPQRTEMLSAAQARLHHRVSGEQRASSPNPVDWSSALILAIIPYKEHHRERTYV